MIDYSRCCVSSGMVIKTQCDMHSPSTGLHQPINGTYTEPQMTDTGKAQLTLWLQQVANQRSKPAFTALFHWFAPKIKRFGMQQFHSEATANELLQITLSNVWKKAHLFNAEKGAATTWVYAIMRNATFDMQRKFRSQREDQLSDDIWPQLDDTVDDEPLFTDHLALNQLQAMLRLLPEAQKQVVEAVYFQELTHEQLAQQLGVPLGTVKSRLRLAIAKLKQQLKEQL